MPPTKDAPGLRTPGIYRIPCECGKVYIGQSGRSVQLRIKEQLHLLCYRPRKAWSSYMLSFWLSHYPVKAHDCAFACSGHVNTEPHRTDLADAKQGTKLFSILLIMRHRTLGCAPELLFGSWGENTVPSGQCIFMAHWWTSCLISIF